jgi:putative flippase GtrA
MKKLYALIFIKYGEPIRYLIVGGINTILNIALFGLHANVIEVNYLISNAVAWVFGVTFAFVANKYIVFKSYDNNRKKMITEAVIFIALRGLSGVFDMVFMYVFIDLIVINNMIAKVTDNVVVIIVNYITTKFIVFKQKKNGD